MAKTKKMAFGGMGNMPSRGGAPAAAAPPTRTQPQVSLPPRPAAPRQTFGDIQAAKMAAQQNIPPAVQAMAQQAMAQSQRARQNMGPEGQGMAQYGARMQQAAQSMAPGRFGQGTPMPPPQMQQGMAPIGSGTQTGGPAPMGMAPPNAAKVGAFKKGGKVCYADGGKAEGKKEAPIPAETLASMKRQAEQEKADRQQAKEQKAGEKEVKENMGRIGWKKGGSIKASKMGAVKVAKPTMRSASSRADGIAIRGKTRA